MATFDVLIKRLAADGTTWDILRPLTVSDNVDTTGQNNKFITETLLDYITTLKTNISASAMGASLSNDLWGNAYALIEVGDITSLGNIILRQGASDAGIKRITSGNSMVFFNGSTDILKLNSNGNVEMMGSNTQFIAGSNYSPTGAKSFATKDYVDSVSLSVKITTAARVVAKSNVNLTGIASIDGITLVANDRVLLVAQTTASQNGIYTWSSAAGGTLTKVTPAGNDNVFGSLVSITAGNGGAGDRYYCIDYSNGLWVLFDSQLDILAGQGITVSGHTVSITNGGVTNAMLAGSINAGKLLKTSTFGVDASGNLMINTEGITNGMIVEVGAEKVVGGGSSDASPWTWIYDASDGMAVSTRLNHILSAIKLLRGEPKFNEDNTRSIADLYTNYMPKKNGTTLSNSNPSATGRIAGDIHFQY